MESSLRASNEGPGSRVVMAGYEVGKGGTGLQMGVDAGAKVCTDGDEGVEGVEGVKRAVGNLEGWAGGSRWQLAGPDDS